jgi:hypothetical protein
MAQILGNFEGKEVLNREDTHKVAGLIPARSEIYPTSNGVVIVFNH